MRDIVFTRQNITTINYRVIFCKSQHNKVGKGSYQRLITRIVKLKKGKIQERRTHITCPPTRRTQETLWCMQAMR